MSSTLLKIASEHSSVVAVVGKGHLQGIKKHWMQPVVVSELFLTYKINTPYKPVHKHWRILAERPFSWFPFIDLILKGTRLLSELSFAFPKMVLILLDKIFYYTTSDFQAWEFIPRFCRWRILWEFLRRNLLLLWRFSNLLVLQLQGWP